MDTQLPQDLLQLLQPQDRVRSTSRGVELLDDQGSWIPIDQTPEGISEQVARIRRTRGRVQATTVRIAMAVQVFYGLSEDEAGSVGDRLEWYLLVEGIPYLLISQTVTRIPGTVFGLSDESGRSLIEGSNPVNIPRLAATREGLVYADFHNYDADIPGLDVKSRYNYHFQIKRGVVSNPDRSDSWRGEYVNNLLPFGSDIGNTIPSTGNACIDRYRIGLYNNIYDNNLWDARRVLADIFSAPRTPRTTNDEMFLTYLKTNSVPSTVTIAAIRADGDICLTANNQTSTEYRKFTCSRVQWDLPTATTFSILNIIAY